MPEGEEAELMHQLGQAIERAESAENQASQLSSKIDLLEAELEQMKGNIALLGNTLNNIIGKDGIKVALPVISLDAAITSTLKGKTYGEADFNVIENGLMHIWSLPYASRPAE